MDDLKEFRSYFEPLYQAHLRRCVDRYLEERSVFGDVAEHFLKIAKGGKRLRPYMLSLAYQSAGGSDIADLLPACFALELYHLFALIHDDIIDRSDERHSVPTLHVLYGKDQAILFGDLCLVWATDALIRAPECTRALFTRLSEETIIGQMLDVSMVGNMAASKEMLDSVVEYKTARYTFTYPMLMGLSFIETTILEKPYWHLGSHLGAAFQRLDNLSDIMLSEEELGKKPGADIVQATPTHLINYVSVHGNEDERLLLQRYFGKKISKEQLRDVQELFVSVGAVAYEKHAIAQELALAKTVLDRMNMNVLARNNFTSCIALLSAKLQKL